MIVNYEKKILEKIMDIKEEADRTYKSIESIELTPVEARKLWDQDLSYTLNLFPSSFTSWEGFKRSFKSETKPTIYGVTLQCDFNGDF